MLKVLQENRLQTQSHKLAFGQTHTVLHVKKARGSSGWDTSLQFSVTRDRKDSTRFFVSTNQSTSDSSGGGIDMVVYAYDWFMIGFSGGELPAKSIMARITQRDQCHFLEYQDAAVWDQEHNS